MISNHLVVERGGVHVKAKTIKGRKVAKIQP